MSKIVTDSKNYSDIADAIRAKGISGTFKPNEMADAIESISGGTEITDGIVVKERDSSNRPIHIEIYGDVSPNLCRGGRDENPFRYMQTVEFKSDNVIAYNYAFYATGASFELINPEKIVEFKDSCFAYSACTQEIEFNNLQVYGSESFNSCMFASLKLPKITNVKRRTFYQSSIPTLELGSVGSTVIYESASGNWLNGFSGSHFDQIAIHTTGNYIDNMLSALRTNVNTATIIFKASEDTTYNGQSYSAGETILTSEVA